MAEFKTLGKISHLKSNVDESDRERNDNNGIPITPPARENTEADLIGQEESHQESSERVVNTSIDIDFNKVQRINTDLCLGVPDNTDVESETDNLIIEMEKIVAFASDVRFAQDDNPDNDEVDEELKHMDAIRRDYDRRVSLAESQDTFSAIQNETWGFTTRTLPELIFTWDSTVKSSEGRTGDLTAYTNQYLHSSASVYTPQKRKGRRRRPNTKEKVGVRWSSHLETRSDMRKLFCYDQFEEKTIEKASQLNTEPESSRNASRLALESREAMFRRAMSLLSARCSSVRQDGADADNALNIGAQVPKYFYVTQEKPLPMEPLKAWRGYHGNIYFEPININPLKADIELQRAQTSVTRTSVPPAQRTRTSVPKARLSKDKENRPLLESRSESRQTNKSSHGSQMSSSRPLAILDKHSVLNRLNENIHEDIVWLEGTENTGSLAVRPKTYPERESKQRERDLQYNKERIRKGSVAHKLYVDSKSKQQPKLSVNGGKFTPPNSLSPLLRTQTQYSLSSHRLTTNSPDPYHLNDSKLPPLDQIRASLKHMDARREQGSQRAKIPYSKSVTITDDMKPFVKYSPDVVAKFAQQANIC